VAHDDVKRMESHGDIKIVNRALSRANSWRIDQGNDVQGKEYNQIKDSAA
jgi:hypothetical protein